MPEGLALWPQGRSQFTTTLWISLLPLRYAPLVVVLVVDGAAVLANGLPALTTRIHLLSGHVSHLRDSSAVSEPGQPCRCTVILSLRYIETPPHNTISFFIPLCGGASVVPAYYLFKMRAIGVIHTQQKPIYLYIGSKTLRQ